MPRVSREEPGRETAVDTVVTSSSSRGGPSWDSVASGELNVDRDAFCRFIIASEHAGMYFAGKPGLASIPVES